MNGVELIAQERQRQIEVEGWTPQHDAEHDSYELSRAAYCYIDAALLGVDDPSEKPGFPWPRGWAFKPDPDPVRNLVKAGALIAAELDRLAAVADD